MIIAENTIISEES